MTCRIVVRLNIVNSSNKAVFILFMQMEKNAQKSKYWVSAARGEN